MQTETSAYLTESKEVKERENKAINNFFLELENEGFTIQEVKNIVTRINARVTSASITNDMRTPFKKDITN